MNIIKRIGETIYWIIVIYLGIGIIFGMLTIIRMAITREM